MEGLAKVFGSRKRAAKEAAAHLVGSKMFYKASISLGLLWKERK